MARMSASMGGGYKGDPSAAHAKIAPKGPDVHTPKPAGKTGNKPQSNVGGETKANMRGALMGHPEENNPLRGATKELASQHPHSYADHGPHHGGKEHIRHQPLHGLHPKGSHGRK